MCRWREKTPRPRRRSSRNGSGPAEFTRRPPLPDPGQTKGGDQLASSEDKLREYLKLVTADLRRTRQRLELVEARDAEPIAIVGVAWRLPRRGPRRGRGPAGPGAPEPIAIVGMPCRFPGGVQSPEDLGRLNAAGEAAG